MPYIDLWLVGAMAGIPGKAEEDETDLCQSFIQSYFSKAERGNIFMEGFASYTMQDTCHHTVCHWTGSYTHHSSKL